LTETLLIYAARADHVKRTIGPALLAGKWVISDRFADSTYAYQGAGRSLQRETIRRIDSVVLDDFKPDLTLMLDLDVETGLKRAKARGAAESRFENFDRDFHERLRQAFLEIAKRNPDRCVIIDAAQDQDAVAAAIWAAVARRFGL
jgi:dTMP kinase